MTSTNNAGQWHRHTMSAVDEVRALQLLVFRVNPVQFAAHNVHC